MKSLLPLGLRSAFRFLAKTPAFSATVVLTLAIGIGATAAVFAVVYGVLLRPLPYEAADRLVTIWSYNPGNTVSGSRGLGGGRAEPLTAVAPPFIDDLRPRLRALDRVAGLSPSWTVTVTGGGPPEVIDAAYITSDLIPLLGILPRLGREFTASEQQPNGPRVAIVSDALWRTRYSDLVSIGDATITINGEPHAIVGVMRAGATLPNTAAEILLPFALNLFAARTDVPIMYLVGRQAPGVSPEDARAELARVSSEMQPQLKAIRAETLVMVPLHERLAADSRRISLVLFTAVALLTLIGCANVSNLLLSRYATRRQEIALRSALGAGRAQVVRQLLLESAVLALAGGAAGLGLAWILVERLETWLAPSLPLGVEIEIDAWVVMFSLGASLLCTIAFGLAPALQTSRSNLAEALRQDSRTLVGGDTRLRGALVAGQVALALVLASGAALLTRSLLALTRVNPGFATEDVVTGGLAFPAARYPQPDQRRAFIRRLEERLVGIPGVTAAGLVNRLPLGSASNNIVAVEAEGFPSRSGRPEMGDRRVGTTGYFATMKIPVLRGRPFRQNDTVESPRVAIVNDAAAQKFWGDVDPIGRRARIGLASGPGPWLTVVGVVGSVRHEGLDSAVRPEIWVPYAQAPVESMVLTVRAAGAGTPLLETVRKAIWELDAELPFANPRTMEDVVAASVSQPRSRTLLVSTIAIVALVLSAVGIGSVVAYSAARMKRDIGVRLALGATAADVRALVTRRMRAPVAIGSVAGVGLSLMASRALTTFLFQVSPLDPLALGGALAGIVALAWMAARLPAWRASIADPSVVLRDS